jgi:hypothetical protein
MEGLEVSVVAEREGDEHRTGRTEGLHEVQRVYGKTLFGIVPEMDSLLDV